MVSRSLFEIILLFALGIILVKSSSAERQSTGKRAIAPDHKEGHHSSSGRFIQIQKPDPKGHDLNGDENAPKLAATVIENTEVWKNVPVLGMIGNAVQNGISFKSSYSQSFGTKDGLEGKSDGGNDIVGILERDAEQSTNELGQTTVHSDGQTTTQSDVSTISEKVSRDNPTIFYYDDFLTSTTATTDSPEITTTLPAPYDSYETPSDEYSETIVATNAPIPDVNTNPSTTDVQNVEISESSATSFPVAFDTVSTATGSQVTVNIDPQTTGQVQNSSPLTEPAAGTVTGEIEASTFVHSTDGDEVFTASTTADILNSDDQTSSEDLIVSGVTEAPAVSVDANPGNVQLVGPSDVIQPSVFDEIKIAKNLLQYLLGGKDNIETGITEIQKAIFGGDRYEDEILKSIERLLTGGSDLTASLPNIVEHWVGETIEEGVEDLLGGGIVDGIVDKYLRAYIDEEKEEQNKLLASILSLAGSLDGTGSEDSSLAGGSVVLPPGAAGGEENNLRGKHSHHPSSRNHHHGRHGSNLGRIF